MQSSELRRFSLTKLNSMIAELQQQLRDRDRG